MNSNKCFVGFDTSNYTTSCAVCDEYGVITANIKIPLPVSDGNCGLRQSDAVFAHIKNFPKLFCELNEATSGMYVIAVGVSAKPRDAEGSYMPCFLTGEDIAIAYSSGLGAPVYRFSHQNGHIMAAAYSSGKMAELLEDEFCAFHVSGGTTEIVRAKPYNGGFGVELLGGSVDLHAGQVIDRIGVKMGLKFPCGLCMETEALKNTGKLPRAKICVNGYECNLSGLENLADKLYGETGDIQLVSAFVLDFIGRTLKKITENLEEDYGGTRVLYAGGVMSNSIIRHILEDKNRYFAEPTFSADNAAGISLLCREKYLSMKEN